MSITMTDAEVREAIAAWPDDHGVPNKTYAIRVTVGTSDHTGDHVKVRVVVETEAPHMEGPYR